MALDSITIIKNCVFLSCNNIFFVFAVRSFAFALQFTTVFTGGWCTHVCVSSRVFAARCIILRASSIKVTNPWHICDYVVICAFVLTAPEEKTEKNNAQWNGLIKWQTERLAERAPFPVFWLDLQFCACCRQQCPAIKVKSLCNGYLMLTLKQNLL